MSTFSYEDFKSKNNNSNNNQQKSKDFKVGYFGLKDDGDTAIVRFNYATPKDFKMAEVHNVKVGDKYRRVCCNGKDNCALCQSGDKALTKFYVELIEYTQNEVGEIVAQAKVWERPYPFASILEAKYDEYGKLCDSIFKIRRMGEKGNLKTAYDVSLANPTIYKDEIYKKDFSAFENFKIDGGMCFMNKSNDDMKAYLDTGEFPQQVKESVSKDDSQPKYSRPQQQEEVNNETEVPWKSGGTSSSSIGFNFGRVTQNQQPQQQESTDRPRRYY